MDSVCTLSWQQVVMGIAGMLFVLGMTWIVWRD